MSQCDSLHHLERVRECFIEDMDKIIRDHKSECIYCGGKYDSDGSLKEGEDE